MNRVVAAFLFLLLISRAIPATIVQNIWDITGSANETTVKFIPRSTPQIASTNYIRSTEKTINTSSGLISIDLRSGDYDVVIGGKASDSHRISVPNDSNTYTLVSLITNVTTYVYRVPGGHSKVSSNDSTIGWLNGKLVAGDNITLTENNDGGDETLTIAATGGGSLTTNLASLTITNNINRAVLAASGASVTIDCNTQSEITHTLSADTTFTFSNAPSDSDQTRTITVTVTGNGSNSASWAVTGGSIVWITSQLSIPDNGAVIEYTFKFRGTTAYASACCPPTTIAQVTGLQTELDGKQNLGDYITELTGDVTGTGPGSTATVVERITETSGPTALTIGTIADGEFLKRVGGTLVSATPSGGIAGTVINSGTPATGNLVRYSDTTGTNVTKSAVTADGSGNMTGITSATVSGLITNAALTASRAVVTGADKSLASSATTATELGYVSGVTSAIQTQLNGKAASGANSDITSLTGLTGAISTPTTISASGQLTLSGNGAASTPIETLTGTWFTGGSATTTKPQLLIEPSGTTSTGWSTSGTGLGINAASGFTGNLIDAQLTGSSKFKVDSTGKITFNTASLTESGSGQINVSGLAFIASQNIQSVGAIGSFGAGPALNAADVIMRRDGAARWQFGNDAATVTHQTIGGHDGSGTDKDGANLISTGGRGTGTGRGGALVGVTSLTTTTGSALQSESVRYYHSAKFVNLTDTTATTFANIALASSKYLGACINATVTANDGTDFQSLTSSIKLDAVNKAGTVTTSISQSDNTAPATSTASTLTVTYTAVANGNGVDIKANATSSLTETVLRIKWAIISLNTDDVGTVTPQ